MTTTIETTADTAESLPTGRRVTPTATLVLPSTAPRDKWLAARRFGITATDVVQIVGASAYGSAADVYADKVGAPLVEDDLSEAGVWGTLLEDTVAREWANRAGVVVRRVGLIAHMDRPWHMASLDRLVAGCPNGRCAVEVKTRNAWVGDQWADDKTPDSVLVQVQAQLDVSGLDHIHIAALIGGQRLVERTIYPDPTTITYLRDEAERVWQAVLNQSPPEIDPALMTVDLLDRIYPNRDGALDLTDPGAVADARYWLGEYAAAGATESDAKKAKEAAKVQLLAVLGEAEELLLDGVTVLTYKASAPSLSVSSENAKRLVAEHPDLAAEYVVERPGSRRFTPKKAKATTDKAA